MTLQELKYRTLLRLGVVAAGDSPNPDDGATVELRYRALYSQLAAENLTRWNVDGSVPREFESPIVSMVVAECARDFGNIDQGVILEGKFGMPQPSPAERSLRRLMSTMYVSTPVKSEYF